MHHVISFLLNFVPYIGGLLGMDLLKAKRNKKDYVFERQTCANNLNLTFNCLPVTTTVAALTADFVYKLCTKLKSQTFLICDLFR